MHHVLIGAFEVLRLATNRTRRMGSSWLSVKIKYTRRRSLTLNFYQCVEFGLFIFAFAMFIVFTVRIGRSRGRRSSVGIATRYGLDGPSIGSMPMPVAKRSKTRVCGHSLAGITGSNPAGGMDVCVVCVLKEGHEAKAGTIGTKKNTDTVQRAKKQKSRWRRYFSHPSRAALGPTQPPIQMGTGSLSRG